MCKVLTVFGNTLEVCELQELLNTHWDKRDGMFSEHSGECLAKCSSPFVREVWDSLNEIYISYKYICTTCIRKFR